ncbi:MAG: hypothetical protein AAFR71_09310 [Pseudomonadota bacterium]
MEADKSPGVFEQSSGQQRCEFLMNKKAARVIIQMTLIDVYFGENIYF